MLLFTLLSSILDGTLGVDSPVRSGFYLPVRLLRPIVLVQHFRYPRKLLTGGDGGGGGGGNHDGGGGGGSGDANVYAHIPTHIPTHTHARAHTAVVSTFVKSAPLFTPLILFVVLSAFIFHVLFNGARQQ